MRPGTLHTRIPARELGTARVVHDTPDDFTRMRAAFSGQPLRAKTYTRLFVDGELWMTDAEYECWTNTDIVGRAYGHVLIAGLGLGLILQPLIDAPDVESITVLERSADVIALIEPIYRCPKLIVIEADARKWEPPKKAYNCIYLDIWADVPSSDNKQEIAALKKHYRPALKKGGRTTAWCEKETRRS